MYKNNLEIFLKVFSWSTNFSILQKDSTKLDFKQKKSWRSKMWLWNGNCIVQEYQTEVEKNYMDHITYYDFEKITTILNFRRVFFFSKPCFQRQSSETSKISIKLTWKFNFFIWFPRFSQLKKSLFFKWKIK